MLNGLRELGTRHFVMLGTCIEYAPGDSPLNEETSPVAPRSLYARCKDELRRALEEEARRHGLCAAWARIFYPYGAGEHPQRLCSSIVRTLREDRTLTLKTPASVKDYIHVRDIAQALLAVAENRFHGTINIGTGQGVAIREIARTVAEMLGKEHLVIEAPAGRDEYPHVVADAAKLLELGWRARYDLRGGLTELVSSA